MEEARKKTGGKLLCCVEIFSWLLNQANNMTFVLSRHNQHTLFFSQTWHKTTTRFRFAFSQTSNKFDSRLRYPANAIERDVRTIDEIPQ